MGITIPVVGIALLVIAVVVLTNRVKKERRFKKSLRATKIYLFKEGNVDRLNPNCTADQQAVILPYNENKWEVPRGNITFGND